MTADEGKLGHEVSGAGLLDAARLTKMAHGHPIFEIGPSCHKHAGVLLAFCAEDNSLLAACAECHAWVAGFQLATTRAS